MNSIEQDVVIAGVPWEGPLTWGDAPTGCEIAPQTIRQCAARYGGFLPEHEINLFDHLTLGDAGDVPIWPEDPERSMRSVSDFAAAIFASGAMPVLLGGDHSFTPAVIEALANSCSGRVGIVHFDAHLDNADIYGNDEVIRCNPLHRIGLLDRVEGRNIAHIAIRGPRNSQRQFEHAREMGSTIFTMQQIRELGMRTVVDDALRIATDGTQHFYVTICSDCIDAGFNPGGAIDFDGLTPQQLFEALYTLGYHDMAGMDFVEVYPHQDANHTSSHLAAWAIVHALAGKAAARRDGLATRRAAGARG